MSKKLKVMLLHDKFALAASLSAAILGAILGSLSAWMLGANLATILVAMAILEIAGAFVGLKISWFIQEKVEETPE